jgi:Ca2+-binding EF-hand superfamily protein
MAMAMAQLATLLVDKGDLEATKKSIVAEVTGEELRMLRKFGLENGDGVIDCAEYIILCMVRMGLDPTLIEFINSEFKRLDDDNSGFLTIEEVTGGKYFLKNGQIMSRDGTQLSVHGLKSFSQRNLQVDFSSSSEEG